MARSLIAGDMGAFDEFVDTFRSKVFRYSLLTCGHRDDAEEVAQETMLQVFRHFDQLRDPANVRAWVFRIARNACYMMRRKSSFAPEVELSLDELMPSFQNDGGGRKLEIADWSALPEAQAANAELGAMLQDAIRALPDIYRSVILMRDVEGMSTQETAEVLEVSDEVVKTRLHRARLAVREKLDRHLQSAGALR